MKMGRPVLAGIFFLVASLYRDAWSIKPFYKVGDTWRYRYFYEYTWMGMVTTDRGWTRVEITSVEPLGDTIRYGYRTADSAISMKETDTVPTGTPFFKEGVGFFGYSQGNFFQLTSPGNTLGLEFFSMPLHGLKASKVKYESDTLEFRSSEAPYNAYEFLENWGPVHRTIVAIGGHSSHIWERNLVEHNGRIFNRTGLTFLDTLHVGVNAGRPEKKGQGWNGGSSIWRLFQGRSIDGRTRIRE